MTRHRRCHQHCDQDEAQTNHCHQDITGCHQQLDSQNFVKKTRKILKAPSSRISSGASKGQFLDQVLFKLCNLKQQWWWVPTRSQTNKSVCSEKQIQPMCGCHCYYLWSLSLNRLLARWARNGQSGLDCINYSSSPLYMAVPCHTILY